MSLAVLANNLASKGRNGDTMLVHMSPNEVAGLHALAVMHGEKLTINPQTGLPEAFSLKSLMPMIVGAALNYFVPGLGSAIGGALGVSGAAGTAIAVGAGYGLANRSLSAGIMAGLGAYGGASLGNALTSTGSLAMNQGAIDATLAANPGLTAGEIGREMGQAGFVAPQIAASANPATAGVFEKLGAGVSALGTAPGRADFLKEIGGTKGLMQAGYAAALPIMADQAIQTKTKLPVPPTTPYQKKPPIVWNWRTGRWEEQLPVAAPAAAPTPTPEQTGQTQPFIEQPPGMRSGGIVALADGGSFNTQMDGGGFGGADFDTTPAAPQFSNEQIYNVYQDLLKQGMTPEQIAAAAQRNPNIGLNAGQINAAVSQFGGAPAVTPAVTAPAVTAPVNIPAPADTGIAGLTTPTSTLGATPPATGGLDTLASQTAAATSTAAPAATTGAGIAGLGAANPFQAGMRQDLYGEFLKAQQTGNWSDFSRKAQEMNMGPEEIAALFPNISAANVTQFAKERGFELGTSPLAFGGRNIQQFLGTDAASRNLAEQLASMTGITLTPEQKADMLSKMAIGSPIDMRPFLAEALEAAIAKKDYSRINDVLAKYDISKSELKNIFNNVNNPAIDEFEKRGLAFNALPDWIGTQRYIPDQKLAADIAKTWKQQYGRDISPDELKTLSFQLGGQYPSTPEQVLAMVKPLDLSQTQAYKDAEARGERYVPDLSDITKAGFRDIIDVGSSFQNYDWNKILASKDPRAAIIATNRLVAQQIREQDLKEHSDTFQKVGEIANIPVLVRTVRGNKMLEFNGANIQNTNQLFEQFYKLGLGSDEMNKLADIVDKTGIKYKPGEVYAGSDAGVDLRDIARGGYGKASNPFDYEHFEAQEAAGPAWARGSQSRYDTIHKGNYYADQLGLSLNRNVTSPYGYLPKTADEIRPVIGKDGKPLNYAVIEGGGVRYFNSPTEAAASGVNAASIIDLTGRSPTTTYGDQKYRPGDVMTPPKAAAEGYLYQPSKAIPAPKATTTPTTTTPTTPTTAPRVTTPATAPVAAPSAPTSGGLAGLAGAGAGGAGAGSAGAGSAGAGAGTTMGGIRDIYTQGGGSTGLQNIGEVRPGQNIYTQNNVVGALQEYMKAFPGASYNQLAAKAKELGIPDPQLRAAINEFRFGTQTGTSKAAYDYLMGRGAYPTTAVLPEGKPIARDYAEAMGLSKPFTAGGERTTMGGTTTPTGSTTTPTGSTTTTSGTTIPASVRASLGTAFTQGDYGSVNNMIQEYKLTVDDILRLFPNLTRAGVMEAVASGKLKPYGLTLTQSGGSGSGMGVGSGLAGLSNMGSSIGAGQTSEVVTEGSGKQTGVIGGDETTGGGSITGGLIDKIIGTQDPSIVPVEDRVIPTKPMAMGGMSSRYNLGGYSDGGRLLRGPGDGVSDSIPATIGDRQPARLADGEFVIPARIVSEIGNGSTEAGARKLYAMMDRVQRARSKTVGKGKVARDTKADKYLPA